MTLACLGIAVSAVRRRLELGGVVLACLTLLAAGAGANELDGAWSTRLEECSNIFTKKGNQTVLADRADFFGSGFVVAGNMIRGKIATCKILSTKKKGSTFQLRTTCATDITISNNNFELTFVEADKVVRSFPGIPEMNTPYYRCPAI